MPIYATKSGSKSGDNFPLQLSSNPKDGSILVYDENKKAFVDTCSNGATNVTGAINLGGENTHSVLADNIGGLLTFRDLKEGSGIVLHSDGDSITISADVSADRLSVPGDYRITIDNDNDSTDAKFEIWTAMSTSDAPVVVGSSIIAPLSTNSIHTGTENGQGYFRETNGVNFAVAGLAAGMWIEVENAGDQTGFWQIDRVEFRSENGNNISTLWLTEDFIGPYGFNLGGPKPAVIIKQADLVVNNHSIISTSVNFEDLGLLAGAVIDFTSDEITGTYEVVSVAGHIITTAEEITDELTLPLHNASFTVQAMDVPTGFAVTEQGNVIANEIHAEVVKVGNPPLMGNDLVNKQYVDAVAKNNKARQYFYSMV